MNPSPAEIEAALRSITALIDRSDSAATDYIHYRLQLLHAQTGRRLPIGYSSQVQSPSSIVLLDGTASSRAVLPSTEWDEERSAVLAAAAAAFEEHGGTLTVSGTATQGGAQLRGANWERHFDVMWIAAEGLIE